MVHSFLGAILPIVQRFVKSRTVTPVWHPTATKTAAHRTAIHLARNHADFRHLVIRPIVLFPVRSPDVFAGAWKGLKMEAVYNPTAHRPGHVYLPTVRSCFPLARKEDKMLEAEQHGAPFEILSMKPYGRLVVANDMK